MREGWAAAQKYMSFLHFKEEYCGENFRAFKVVKKNENFQYKSLNIQFFFVFFNGSFTF